MNAPSRLLSLPDLRLPDGIITPPASPRPIAGMVVPVWWRAEAEAKVANESKSASTEERGEDRLPHCHHHQHHRQSANKCPPLRGMNVKMPLPVGFFFLLPSSCLFLTELN